MVLASGSLLVDRFKIDRLAGEGGMGKVYRAQDVHSGQWVAVKQLHGAGSADDAERLLREARLLAAIRHPGIVAYIDHGLTPDGAPYLTTEWLDGEDLAQRLRRGPLTIRDTLLLLEQIAEPLAEAHKHGIIHRDLKPSNLFLVDRQLDRVKLLDFGIARRLLGVTSRTKTGVIVGTPEYMSPEQARGTHELAPAVDVFALGCVLYECLTGRPPFVAEHVTAILIRILFELPVPLGQLVPHAPQDLVALVHRMLAKEPTERPRNGGAVLAELRALRVGSEPAGPQATAESAPLTRLGRQLISMVLAVPQRAELALQTTAPHFPARMTLPETLPPAVALDKVRPLFVASGCRVEELADGSLTAIFVQAGAMTATDLAVQAARCALLLKAQNPTAKLAMTTGRSTPRTPQPYQEAISRAERLLSTHGPAATGSDGGVHLDDVTAGLLDGLFEVRSTVPGHALLLGERTSLDESRPLLGRPTPCVGRDQDLILLETALTSCLDDPSPRVVLVTAPPGIGKSRLRHEFLRRLRTRGLGIEVLIGRGDTMSVGASYGLLGQALRRLCGILDGTSPEARRAQLLRRVGQCFPATGPGSEGRRIAEFLGELCGVAFPDEDSPALRAARQDPYMMSERIREAFLGFLAAEARAHPILLVLEDLHWGDALTVRLIDAALRDLTDLPLLVLALARPEVKGLFPGLWEGRQRQEINLGPLSKRACERLVSQVLGTQASAEQIARIVARAGGNALFLEELIRALADDKGDELPETILAMLHARFARLDEWTRSVLHAASVFGETFWRGGVLALVGSGGLAGRIDGCLQTLINAEIVEPHSESRLVDESEYKFRHALIRDAAYGLLTEDERVLAHAATGSYLETAGEPDPMVLAEHYERGKALSAAARWYARAAEQAHWGGDTPSAIARAQRGLRCDLSLSGQAAMLSLLAEAYGWSGDFVTGSGFAEQALQRTIPGSRAWASALATLQSWALLRGDLQGMRQYTRLLLATPPLPDAVAAVAFALMATSYINELALQCGDASQIVHSMESLCTSAPGPLAGAWRDLASAFFHVQLTGEPWTALERARRAQLAFAEAGHRRGALSTRIAAGLSLWRLGQHGAAEQELRATLDTGVDFGPITPQRDAALVCVVAEGGDLVTAQRLARAHLDAARAAGRPLDQGLAHWALAEALRHTGELAPAEAAAQQAIEHLGGIELHLLEAQLTLAAIRLRLGRAAEALTSAEQVLARHDAAGAVGCRSALAHLVCTAARRALGDRAGTHAALTQSQARLLAQSACIADPELRQSFLRHVPEHLQLLALIVD